MYRNLKFNRYLVTTITAIVFFFLPLGNTVPLLTCNAYSAHYNNTSNKNENLFKEELRKGYRSFSKNIDLEKYAIKYEKITELIYSVIQEKEFFYVSSTISGNVTNDGFIVNIYPSYITNRSGLQNYKKSFYKSVNSIVSAVQSKWSPVQKVAYIHDEIVTSCTYSKSNEHLDSTPWNCLVNHYAKCSGMSRAFAVLCSEFDIPVVLIGNNDHMWNLVEINKKWYHVDCQADMGYTDKKFYGMCYHKNFLKSDSALLNHGKYSTYGLKTSTTFDNFKWNDSNSRFGIVGNCIYYFDGNNLMCYNEKKQTISKVADVDSNWKDVTHKAIWASSFAKILCKNGCVYYNTEMSVMEYNPKTKKIKTVITLPEKNDILFGIVLESDKVYGLFATNPNLPPRKKYIGKI